MPASAVLRVLPASQWNPVPVRNIVPRWARWAADPAWSSSPWQAHRASGWPAPTPQLNSGTPWWTADGAHAPPPRLGEFVVGA